MPHRWKGLGERFQSRVSNVLVAMANCCKELKMDARESKCRQRASFFEVAITYLTRFVSLYVMFRVVEDVDSIRDLLIDRFPYVGVDWLLLVLAVVFFASLCQDCYCRFRTGLWVRSRMGVQKRMWVELVWVSIASVSLLVYEFVEPETKRGTVDGVTWRYTVSGGNSIVGRDHQHNRYDRSAISVSISGHLAIPQSLGGHPVKGVGKCAFRNCIKLTSVAIPESVTSVGEDAFRGCRIEKVYVEKGDAARIKELLRGKGVDVDKVEFVEREEAQAVSHSGVLTCRP